VTGEPSSGFRSVLIPSFFYQAQDQIVDDGQNAPGGSFGHARCIFMESDISAVVQSSFD
jgi:hypothetical protein